MSKPHTSWWRSPGYDQTIVAQQQETDHVTGDQLTRMQGQPEVQQLSHQTAAKSNAAFDPITMMLIESEFRDLSPAEREQWFHELRYASPEIIPQLIRVRRLTLKHAQPPNHVPYHVANMNQAPAYQTRQTSWTPPSNQQPHQSSYPVEMNRHPQASGMPQTNNIQTASGTNLPATISNGGQTIPSSGQSSRERDTAQTLAQLINLMEQDVSYHSSSGSPETSDYLKDQVNLRMLYMMANREERSLEAIPGLSPPEQEYWQKIFWAMSSSLDDEQIPNADARATHTITQLTEAADRLREKANLEIRNVSFSKGIQGFGSYDRFDKDEFQAGQPVLIYAEMRNFKSERTTAGQYRTVLKSTIEIHRAGSNPGLVISQDYPATEDFCRTHRHDYFHSYKINIPDELTVGPYVMKLIVEDQLSKKVATYSLNFLVN